MNSEDAALKRGIVAASSRVIVTASSEKLGAQGTYHVATLSEVDDIVVDALAPTFHLKAFADAGIAEKWSRKFEQFFKWKLWA
jgi:DeoR/GlpR family transcriptional regulator of sugar metabolism